MSWPAPVDAAPITPHLAPGEQLLWSGRPNRLVSWTDLPLVLFGAMFFGFSVFWETMVVTTGAPLMMRVWGIPFILVGLYLMLGRVVQSAWSRRHTWYALTDQRAMIVTGSGRNVRSLALSQVADFSVLARSDGSGSLVFSPPLAVPRQQTGFGGLQFSTSSSWSERSSAAFVFFSVPDVRAVEAMLNSYRQGLR